MRLRTVAPVIASALVLAACGTWDPTYQGPDQAAGSVAANAGKDQAEVGKSAEITVGDSTFRFSLDECQVANGKVDATGTGENGEKVTIDSAAGDNGDASVAITDQAGTKLYTAGGQTGQSPSFEMTQGGFAASGGFVDTNGASVVGELKGAC